MGQTHDLKMATLGPFGARCYHRQMLPLKRRGDLIVRQVSDETLVYDERNDRAHCLNRAAALVWEHCDGRTTIEEIAGVLNREMGISSDADVVRRDRSPFAATTVRSGEISRRGRSAGHPGCEPSRWAGSS